MPKSPIGEEDRNTPAPEEAEVETSVEEQDVDTGSSPDDVSPEEADRAELLEAVQEVFPDSDYEEKPEGSEDEAASSADSEEQPEQPKDEKSDDDRLDEEIENDLRSFGKDGQKRIRQRLKDLKGQVESMSPQAEQFTKIEQFQQANGLTPKEMAEGIKFAATLAGVKAGRIPADQFLSQVNERLLSPLRRMTGDELPDDLRQRVDDGFIDESSAREIATGRIKQHQQTASQAVQASQQAHAAMSKELSSWSEQVAQRDPDYAMKEELVTNEVERLRLRHGAPKNPQMVRQLLDAAYENVNRQVGAMRPQKKATKPSPNALTSSPGRTSSEPKSAMDAAMNWFEGS